MTTPACKHMTFALAKPESSIKPGERVEAMCRDCGEKWEMMLNHPHHLDEIDKSAGTWQFPHGLDDSVIHRKLPEEEPR